MKPAKPTTEQLQQAVIELGMCKYFPTDEATRAAIMALLRRMCATSDQLQWLVRTMIDQVGEWKGPTEFRGLFCTRFNPADGVWPAIDKPGYEARRVEIENTELERKMANWKREKLLETGDPNGVFHEQLLLAEAAGSKDLQRAIENTKVRQLSVDPEQVRQVEAELLMSHGVATRPAEETARIAAELREALRNRQKLPATET